MVSRRLAILEGRELPWMQVAGSSVLILPLHACDIVAALFQTSSCLGGKCLTIKARADMLAREMARTCFNCLRSFRDSQL